MEHRINNGDCNASRNMAHVATYPARLLWALEDTIRWDDRRPAKELRAGDLLCCPEGLTTYTVGTVISYALDNGDDPIAAVRMAVSHGYELAWINQNGGCITSHERPIENCIVIRPGDTIRLEGRCYTVEKGNNPGNLSLVPRAEEAGGEQAHDLLCAGCGLEWADEEQLVCPACGRDRD